MAKERLMAGSKRASSESLARRAQEGDRGAFALLVERHREELERAIGGRAVGKRAAQDRTDILQETLARALESISRFEWQGEDSFLKWLLAIARHVQVDLLRSRRTLVSLEAADAEASREPSPSRVLRREERFERLQSVIESLPPDHREVVRLSRIEGLKLKQVADRLGKSHDSVKHLLARALKLLRSRMGETGSLRLPPRSSPARPTGSATRTRTRSSTAT